MTGQSDDDEAASDEDIMRDEGHVERTIRKTQWRKKRELALWEYTQFEFRQTPVSTIFPLIAMQCSLTIFQLLEELSLVTSVQSWTAIVGSASHLVDGHWSAGYFNVMCTDRLRHCAHLARTMVDGADVGHDRLAIQFGDE